jgi:uncharacterized membrane protein
MISLDFSAAGKNIKSELHWLRLHDASTARSIISAIAAGIISLTVFSFSMVMIVLNQAASQMSNRVLDKLIGNRSQQLVLGFYIGTIVYALFLLSTVRDIDSGIYVPALSTYLLIALTVIDIFLFIYFLHYITRSVKYDTIIGRIFKQTKQSLEKKCTLKEDIPRTFFNETGLKIRVRKSGNYQNFQQADLLKLCEQEKLIISFIYPPGTFVLKGTPFLTIINTNRISSEVEDRIHILTSIVDINDIDQNYYYGFQQLKEVAIKALSPGINDPGTAILSLHALADLVSFRAHHFPPKNLKDSTDSVRIIIREKSFDEICTDYLLPVWDYGKNDRSVQQEMQLILSQLVAVTDNKLIRELLHEVKSSLNPYGAVTTN